jgi:uncharacterized sporulation protein YeaH/YhbH (DUF444 family)
MDQETVNLFKELINNGVSTNHELLMRRELEFSGNHTIPDNITTDEEFLPYHNFSLHNDHSLLQPLVEPRITSLSALRSLDELLDRDNKREADGFPRKIRVGRLIKPGRVGKGKIVIVPSTDESKFYHDRVPRAPEDGGASGGTGSESEGEIIGEQPVRAPGAPGSGGSGKGEGDSHELESSVYDLGKILTEKFSLPNLKEKGRKRSLNRYTYDLTDRNRGIGQVLDKKSTLRRIIETNLHLGNIEDVNNLDPSNFLISPRDKVYRILSREKDYESQAMVFFLRDYSGSMAGKATELVSTQHVLIYSWLIYQYSGLVESRFILHDVNAKEVPDFYTYYSSSVAGGTKVASAYQLVNELVEKENLAKDYNIYVFQGTDGDDWDENGKEGLPELRKILSYASRVGITIAEHDYASSGSTEVERYLRNSGILNDRPNLIRLDVVREDADESRLIDGIRRLIT